MKKINYLLFIGLLTFALISCDEDDSNPPTISSISPTEAHAGDSITITGTNFQGVTKVSIGTSDAGFKIKGTSIRTMVPANAAAGTVDVSVVNGDGTAKKSFVVLSSAPTIASFLPTAGVQGDQVVVVGTLLKNITSFMLGDKAVTSYEETPNGNSVTFTVPADATTGKIKIVTSLGEKISTQDFTVIPSYIVYRGEIESPWFDNIYSWGDPVIDRHSTEKLTPGSTMSMKVTISAWTGIGFPTGGFDITNYSTVKVNLQSNQVGKVLVELLGPVTPNPADRNSVGKFIELTQANTWTEFDVAGLISEYKSAYGNTVDAFQIMNFDENKVLHFDYIYFQ